MKKKLIPSTDEFYIGYLSHAPAKTASFIRRVTIILGAVVILACGTLAFNQKRFSNGIFEFGKLSTIQGVVSVHPVPNIRIQKGDKTTMILLVGFGKKGAMETVSQIEEKTGKTLREQFVQLRGTRIYDHGKEILQITLDDNLTIEVLPMPENFPSLVTERLGNKHFEGEIVDPKCFFGVMKPGEGKPHRSCAIRCIAGGVSPVLTIKNEADDFVILTGENINEEILPLVGDPVQLKGEVVVVDSWKIMQVDMSNVKLLSKNRTKEKLFALEEEVPLCITSPEY